MRSRTADLYYIKRLDRANCGMEATEIEAIGGHIGRTQKYSKKAPNISLRECYG